MNDHVYASAAAYGSGRLTVRHSVEILGRHPELAVFAPFPFTVSAAPLRSAARRFGTLTATWPQTFHRLTDAERAHLTEAAARLAVRLDRLASRGVPMEPGHVPRVVAGEAEETGGAVGSTATAPLVYHLHKLAAQLASARTTDDAVARVLARTVHGFGAREMAISLVSADRLRVIGASPGCSRSFLRTLNGLPLGRAAPETEAIARRRQLIHGPSAAETSGRVRPVGDRDDTCSWVILPLLAGGDAIGACSIAYELDQRSVSVAGQAVLTALSTLLGQTFERTQLHDRQVALARELQQALLPRTLPQPAGIVSTSRYLPTTGVDLGGDWYDLIDLPSGEVAAVIGDVQGHNSAAAVVMGQLRSAVRAYATEGHGPAEVLGRTNRLLLALETDLFATCCCVGLDPDTGRARVASAGHPLPLIRDADDRPRPGPALRVGTPLGVEDDPGYRSAAVSLAPGTLIALHTDGLLRGGTAAEILDAALVSSGGELETLGDRMISATGTHPHADDTALLLVKYEGPSVQARRYVRQLGIHRRDLEGVRRTRAHVREWLTSWGLASSIDDVEVLMSEIVTNALIHGDSDVHVHVRRYAGRLRVEVRDSDPRPAQQAELPADGDEAESGRGLIIVEALASAWGNSPSGRGKTVWFELPVADA